MEKLVETFQTLKTYSQKYLNNSPQSTYIEFDDFFQSEKLINFLGLSNLPRDAPLKRSTERRAFYTMSMINSIAFLGLVMVSIAFGISYKGSFPAVIENVAIVCIEGLVLMKGFTIMYWHREKLMEIILKLKQHFPHDAWNQHVFHVPQHLKILNIYGTITSALYSSVVIEFTSVPIIIFLYGLVLSHKIELEMIIQLQLPLNTSAFTTYVLIYFINIWAFIVGTITILITDLLFVELVAVINMELTALAQLISEIDPAEGQDEAFDELRKLLITHQELINLSDDLKDILSPLLFIDCFGMLITICCCAFLTLSGISTYFLVKYILALIVTMWNTFIHCFYGTRLNDASLSVAEGAYSCNWLSGNAKFRKMILIVMVRAQRPQELTGMEFVNMNLETYTWIIDAAFSYYSVLVALYSP